MSVIRYFQLLLLSLLYGVFVVILTSPLFGVFSRGSLVKETAATNEKVSQRARL